MATYAKLQNADSIEVVDIRGLSATPPTFTQGLASNTISERTAAAGVTVDGLLIKDSAIAHTGITATWSTWSPSVSCSGSMTFTGITVDTARYIQIGKMVFVTFFITGTVGGTPSSSIFVTTPVTAASATAGNTATRLPTTGGHLTGWLYLQTTTAFNLSLEGFANFAAGAASIDGIFFYEAA